MVKMSVAALSGGLGKFFPTEQSDNADGSGDVTIADTSHGVIQDLFFERVKSLTLSSKKASYSTKLGSILENYAPESSRLYRLKAASFR